MRTAFSLICCGALLSGAVLRAQDGKDTKPEKYIVKPGTRIPLVLVNSISTKNSREGDRVYLQTAFPIAVDSHIVIPEGSYVTGTITQIKRPGRVKGRAELYVRFDTLMLPNGVQRDFRAVVSQVDADQNGKLNDEGKVEGDSSKGKDVATTADAAATGATIGGIAGGGKGAGIGAGIGAAAGLGAVLLTRGEDMKLPRGSSVEMQLDRELSFTADEVNFLGSAPPPRIPPAPPAEGGSRNNGWPGSRFPVPF